ncbi:MAG: hypothetical protein VXW87_01485 [Pseudomonadota bacterium]|nr:hypothetical protein [Pseudomonadota bacterium]
MNKKNVQVAAVKNMGTHISPPWILPNLSQKGVFKPQTLKNASLVPDDTDFFSSPFILDITLPH